MNKLTLVVSAIALAGMMAGCASVPIAQKVGEWQSGRPYAGTIKKVRDSGRPLHSSDVDLVFTMEDFKKELPDCAASIDAVLALGKTTLNVVAEVGNTASPLYVAAVDSVDRTWAMYVGRDVETDANGDIEKYLEGVEPEYREQTRKDWEAYQKIVKYVPDPKQLAQGKAVYQRYLKDDGKGGKELDVLSIERLPYLGKPELKEYYFSFLVYRDNTPEVQKAYDNAVEAKLKALLVKIQVQMEDMLAAAQKLKADPEVSKLNIFDVGLTLKGVATGIVNAFADPLGKVGSAIKGYSLASEVEELAQNTQQAEQTEASKAKKD